MNGSVCMMISICTVWLFLHIQREEDLCKRMSYPERMLGRLYDNPAPLPSHFLQNFKNFLPVLCYLSLSSLSYLQSQFSQSSSVPAAPLSPFMQKGRDGAKGGSEGEKPLKGGRAAILCRCGKKVGDLGAWSRRGPSAWAVGSSGGA